PLGAQRPQRVHVASMPELVVAHWGLQDHGDVGEPLVVEQPRERLLADETDTDVLVPVLVAAERMLGVVDVHTAQVAQADLALEVLEHSLVPLWGHEVVAGRVGMTGVEADPYPLLLVDERKHRAEFL